MLRMLTVLCWLPASALAFTFQPAGTLVQGSGVGGASVGVTNPPIAVDDMRFPFEAAPAYPNSQVYGVGGLYGPSGGQCDSRNYSYPWWDNYCESRTWSMPLCPSGAGHQGQDIRPATCQDAVHWAVAAEDGVITSVGTYSVYLQGDSGVRHRYLHMKMNALAIQSGQRVTKGQRMGKISNDFGGTPTTIHLHYDLYENVAGIGNAYVSPYTALVDSYERLLGLTPSGGGLVVDSNNALNDDSEGYIEVSTNWAASTSATGFFNTGYYAAPGLLGADDDAIFWFRQDDPTCVDIQAWWTSGTNRAPDAPWSFRDPADRDLGTTFVDQTTDGSQWVSLGKREVGAGWSQVRLSRDVAPDDYVIADAIRVLESTDCPTDLDLDGVPDSLDGCPADPAKVDPGACGCGTTELDSDGDGTADCIDDCPTDGAKTDAGVCGCGTPDVDSDGDGTMNCMDDCPADPGKTTPGVCDCGTADVDADGDGLIDCGDTCPADPDKTAPGLCGCGVPDDDADADSVVDCLDGCPDDGDKTVPGVCGCGTPDLDGDGDGTWDCVDGCPADPGKTVAGACGCGTPDLDVDGDGAWNCYDGCPTDPHKTVPGICGCGLPDVDTDGDGLADCSRCGDGTVQTGETCDDGNTLAGDGCSNTCAAEALILDPPFPATAGADNTFTVRNARPTSSVYFLAATQPGSTAVPGCPGLTAPLRNPTLIRTEPASSIGIASWTTPVPATFAGRSYGLVAVELATCRISAVRIVGF